MEWTHKKDWRNIRRKNDKLVVVLMKYFPGDIAEYIVNFLQEIITWERKRRNNVVIKEQASVYFLSSYEYPYRITLEKFRIEFALTRAIEDPIYLVNFEKSILFKTPHPKIFLNPVTGCITIDSNSCDSHYETIYYSNNKFSLWAVWAVIKQYKHKYRKYVYLTGK